MKNIFYSFVPSIMMDRCETWYKKLFLFIAFNLFVDCN